MGTTMTNAKPYYYTWCQQPDAAVERFPVTAAERDEFVLQDGRRIYDLLSTSFQANFGHGHPVIREAIKSQLDTMAIASPKATFDLKNTVSERLLELIGLPNGRMFYTVSGSESVENALKIARQITGRTIVAARQRSYHGATLGALSVTGDWRNGPHFTLDEHTLRIPEPHDDPQLTETRQRMEAIGKDNIAAVILETVSGTNGVIIPEPEWLQRIATLCQEHGIFLIIDEVLCGFGRTGPHFAFQSYDIVPDMVCMSKAITGGYVPFGAVWTGPRVHQFYERQILSCGLTNYAHPLGLAALSAVLDLLSDPALLENKRQLEDLLSSWLSEVSKNSLIRATRCRGLLAAIELNGPAPVWDEFLNAGLHAFSKESLVVVAPPFVSKPERLAAALEQLTTLLGAERSTR